MRRDADVGIIERPHRVPGALEQYCVAVDVIDESRPGEIRRGSSKAGMGVKGWEERQADPNLMCGSRDTVGQLGGLGKPSTLRSLCK